MGVVFDGRMVDRRTLLRVSVLGATLPWAAACSRTPDPKERPVTEPERYTYGDDPSQWADLYLPTGTPRGVVVVIHGGFWRAAYDAGLGVPLAVDLSRRGWAAWNLEYRRVGNGGGVPETLDDVAAGIDRLADVPGLDVSSVVTLGHSAGGHLAVWAAARGRFARWQPARIPVAGALSQAGVLDLTRAAEDHLGNGAIVDFVGSEPGPSYDEVDPQRHIPLKVPVWCVHGREDDVVPVTQSQAYVEAAMTAGATARLVEVPGDHFVVIDPASEAWDAVLEGLEAMTFPSPE